MTNLAEFLEPYRYVVLRNWESLPDLHPLHPDLDIYVCEEQAEELRLACREMPWVDIRSPKDNYFPVEIENKLLLSRRPHNGFWIPSAQAYFLSLYYHVQVHKEKNKRGLYEDDLRKAFLEIYPPIKSTDEGVGYYTDGYYRNQPTV